MPLESELEGTYLEATIGGETRRFPLAEGSSWTIGRDARNAIVLAEDIMVSRKHAMVQRDASGVHWISDLGSRNGTSVNGLPVTSPVRLHDGDVFTIGSQEFVFHRVLADLRDPTAMAGGATALRVVRRMLTVLVVDIRNFTGLSRALGEARLSELMGQFFRDSGELLRSNGSWTQKYIGDAVMAAWAHDDDAITPAELVLMLESLQGLLAVARDLNERFAPSAPLVFGAGVNSGFAATGNMGSAALSDHTALGDTVNKAFRLESASKEVGRDVVFGRDSFELLAAPADAQALFTRHSVLLKGYDEADEVYGLNFDQVPRLLELLRS